MLKSIISVQSIRVLRIGVVMRTMYISERRGVVFITEDGKKRRYPEKDSPWCNPYKIGKDGDRQEVLNKYRKYISGRSLDEIRGKTLGCWCKPEDCHGDILLELLS